MKRNICAKFSLLEPVDQLFSMGTGQDDEQCKMLKTKREYKGDKQRPRLLSQRHRLHRSAVRPFFCCGSQLSLNSITEVKELSVIEKEKGDVSEDDYEDLSDSDDLNDDMDSLQVSASRASVKSEPSTSIVRPSTSKRKKLLLDKPHTNNRKKFWTMKLKGKLPISKRSHYASESKLNSASLDDCVCTSFKASCSDSGERGALLAGARVNVPASMVSHLLPSTSGLSPRGSLLRRVNDAAAGTSSNMRPLASMNAPLPFIPNFNTLYPINDIDEQLIRQRRYEMEHGILEKEATTDEDIWLRNSLENLEAAESTPEPDIKGQYPSYGAMGLLSSEALRNSDLGLNIDAKGLACSTLSLNSNPWVPNIPRPQGVHTQVDYKHHLVPDMARIINSSFYWGVMDRYQAEKLIENKPEGTFLLRDSAQDEFLFSVSFRRYGRSLHARIEQWNHKFSFDSRDPGVYATDSVCGLIEHYKDPSCCMFFEPMLTLPLHRNFPFSLQHLARAAISTNVNYDGIVQLPLPASLREFLRFYHYKQKVRVRRFDNVA